MNGFVSETERELVDRHSAVDVTNGANNGANGAKWDNDTNRLSTYSSTGDRSTLLRSHAAKSAEIGPQSPRPRRAPRESRRVSLAQVSGYVQLNQYRLLEPIGQGSYGIVKLAYNEEDDTHYAMKILSKRKLMRRAGLFGRTPPRRPGPGPPPDPLERVYREIAVLKKLDHPNVVKLVEVLDDPAEDQLYLVFQLLEGGPVIDIPTDNPLSEDLARKYFRDALLGVEYLHYQRIAHRDIKPANLLLGEDRVQVADLGACGELAGRLSGAVGTPAFRAPEAAAPTDNYCGEAADIWSLGVTLYAMVSGRVPWVGASSVELQKKVISEPLTFPPKHQLSKQLRHLLSRMLDKDPVKRATMKEIKEHPWITHDGKDPLPSEEENCRLVEVTEEDMAKVVTSIPNLSTLILIKTMLKKHSFQNPFLRSREGSTARRDSTSREGEGEGSAAGGGGAARGAGGAGRRAALARAGRSLSAPGAYLTERQASFDVALESVEESKDQSQDANKDKLMTIDSQNSTEVNIDDVSSENKASSSSTLKNNQEETNIQNVTANAAMDLTENKTTTNPIAVNNLNAEKSSSHNHSHSSNSQNHSNLNHSETNSRQGDKRSSFNRSEKKSSSSESSSQNHSDTNSSRRDKNASCSVKRSSHNTNSHSSQSPQGSKNSNSAKTSESGHETRRGGSER